MCDELDGGVVHCDAIEQHKNAVNEVNTFHFNSLLS
jgi:hypothetical protein